MAIKKHLFISIPLLILILIIGLLALNNGTKFVATLDFFNSPPRSFQSTDRKPTTDDSNLKYDGPCRGRDFVCGPWQINCNRDLTQSRNCQTINACTGGYFPPVIKKCTQLGNPQKYSPFSECSADEIADSGSALVIAGVVTDEKDKLPIRGAYIWLTDEKNVRLYLEDLSDEAGRFELIFGLDNLRFAAGTNLNLHVAPVESGYGGNVGSVTSRPQCPSVSDLSSRRDTFLLLNNGLEKSLIHSELTFSEYLQTLQIPDPETVGGLKLNLQIFIPLLEDNQEISYRLL